jgi:hypothetical protein
MNGKRHHCPSNAPSASEQVVKEQARIRHSAFAIRHCGNPSPPFGFLAEHNRPTDGLGVGEDPGLDGFVFSACGHRSKTRS